MHWLALGMAGLIAAGIIAIGTLYLARPRTAARGFGLLLPEEGANIDWWLRLKGVRDIASGLVILACMTWFGQQAVGLVLFVYAVVPIGDMLVVFGGKGSAKSAIGIHGVTATVMILASIPLMTGAR